MSTIEEIEKRRAERKAKLQEQADAQRALDMQALDEAEIEHGDTSVCHIDVPYTPGLPTMVIGRMPKAVELKAYRAKMKVTPGETLDLAGNNDAASLLGDMVRVYPPKPEPGALDLFAAMCTARPDLKAQLGLPAAKLASGKAAEDSKD